MIRGELDWINYLSAGGVRVAKAVASDHGELVESIDDGQGGCFLAAAFEKAPGRPTWERDFWERPQWFEGYGRMIGRMHRLSKGYQPADPTWKRAEWDDPVNIDMERWLPKSEVVVLAKYDALVRRLRQLPKDDSSYGLIHQDAHAANFFVDDDGSLTLFDFDDCAYGWYVYDLAMVLFYAITNRTDAENFGPLFWREFMRGYERENQLDPTWFKEIPHFLKLREIDLYAVIHRSLDLETFNGDSWAARFMDGRKARIENDVPYIQFEI
jgi:Ser/Thr protein kinase RdoA (MazF antagonist)